MRRLTAIGLILAAIVFLAGSSDAQRAPFWPATTGDPVIQEWYADIPWHQKLGTYAGNEIDVPIILPYDALPQAEKDFCTRHNLSEPACMLEVGINNVLGVYRTDTLYDPADDRIKNAAECSKDPTQPCVEVKLELSSFWTRSTGSSVEVQPRPFGTEPQHQPDPPFTQDLPSYYGGYTITDGSTYAPQLPWYMSHYCDALYPSTADTQDPVCYADYFSPMNSGFNLLPTKRLDEWPRSVPWSVFPAAKPLAPTNHCEGGLTKCTLAMAGFDLAPVPQDEGNLQYKKYNDFLVTWFNSALTNFPTDRDNTRHFPWSGATIDWAFIYPRAIRNPFLGTFAAQQTDQPFPSADACNTTIDTNGNGCTNTGNMRAKQYLYPRKCSLQDLTKATAGSQTAVEALRNCGLNYELHHNGYWEQWPRDYWKGILDAGVIANQYGRTSFLFAGVPGMQFPVSFYKEPDAELSIYERVYNATIFSLDLPVANVADDRRSMAGRRYTDLEFYHTLLMSNHMESDPVQFAEGISGKALWHNEYRTQKMYESRDKILAKTYTFAAAFDPQQTRSPFHNYTCDGCHVRNGSGVPINTLGTLDPKLQEFMKGDKYQPYNPKDYTFTGEIQPMKLVFFDLRRKTSGLDTSRYSKPLAFPLTLIQLLVGPALRNPGPDILYNNKVMNFYGDSFHVQPPDYNYVWKYGAAAPNRMVVPNPRLNKELSRTYEPLQVKLGEFVTSANCQLAPAPAVVPWPKTCADIDSAAIHSAIELEQLGFMHLNGKRLGNLSAIEAIPNKAILGFYEAQKAALGEKMAGEVVWNAGSRDGVNGEVRPCTTKSPTDCYIARFGWLGDRVSLEDQVANAAFVEMNITTKEGYKKLYPDGNVQFPIRYANPNCGAANQACVVSTGNSDLSELDVQRMADYARWVGNPTRSEFQVSQAEVIQGEKIFSKVKCDTCHVTRKLEIPDPDDTMLSKFFRDRLATRTTGQGDKPFLSYIGTDLLMHDMGYLSQVGNASESIRDEDGVVKPEFRNYVQKIRTPALKGLRFNRFVTDSHRNTKEAGKPACDFLLHDGRACDALEAAFLHDGPAIKKLGTIEELNKLSPDEIRQLRAFLYSL